MEWLRTQVVFKSVTSTEGGSSPYFQAPFQAVSPASRDRLEQAQPQNVLIRATKLRKEYQTGAGRLVLFDGLSFSVQTGEMLAIVGSSGTGKSTLLHILGALDSASGGDVYFASINVGKLTPKQAADFRNTKVGYVWQMHCLLPEFTAAENVAMPLLARGQSKASAFRSAAQWLAEVGLADRAGHRAGELSGGEQQRVSLARALVTGPALLLADEPTGDLDSRTSESIFKLIERLHREHGLTSIIVTHNSTLAQRCSRVVRLEDGHLETGLMEKGLTNDHALDAVSSSR